MPRKPADARAMTALRGPDAPLPPPDTLSAEERRIWLRITATKPASWFDEGNAPMLEAYCEASTQRRVVTKAIHAAHARGDYKTEARLEKRFCQLAATQCSLATKLRLTVQYLVSIKDRKLQQRGSTVARTNDPLLGGTAAGWEDPDPKGRKDN